MKFSNPNTQRGLSFWYFIWQVVFFICVSYILIIGIPPYLDNAKIQRALDSLVEERSVQTMSRAQIVKALNRKLNIDVADDIVLVSKEDIMFKLWPFILERAAKNDSIHILSYFLRERIDLILVSTSDEPCLKKMRYV